MSRVEPKTVERIVILGAGTIGGGWATHYLAQGKAVTVTDPAPNAEARLRAFIDKAWPAVQRLGLAPGSDPAAVRFVPDAAEAVRDAQFVQESGPESVATKVSMYRQIERTLPEDAVVATSTSGLSISELQEGRVGPGRYVVGHPFNPPHIIPLVEVVGGRQTDPAVVDWTLDFYGAHGKRAIHIRREVPGHLANRLQVALWREAVHAVATGIASVEDVVAAVVHALGPRWALVGPHLTIHLAGGEGGMRHHLEHLGPAIEDWWADLGSPSLTPDVKAKLIEGMDAETAGTPFDEIVSRRDKLLVAFLEMQKREAAAAAGSSGPGADPCTS